MKTKALTKRRSSNVTADFKVKRYPIATVEGPWPVSGLVSPRNPNLALRLVDGTGDGLWTIDHIPTGWNACNSIKLTREQGAALILALADLDWNLTDTGKIAKYGPRIYAAMDALMIDYGQGIRIKSGDVVTIDLSKMKDGESVKFRLG